jgi:DNA-binding transcriptional MerR regulator
MDGRLRIGELGARVGLSTATLRYYESLGLLGEPERSPSGYRLYGTDDEERLRFIIRAKALDLSLDEIRSLLELWHQGTCTETRSTLRHLVAHKIREARSRAQEAAAFADQLTHVYARLGEDVGIEAPAHHEGPSSQRCGCIPDLPPAEALDLDAELALIEQSVCGCGARLDEAAGAPEACACGCCAPDGAEPGLQPAATPVFLRTSTGEEVKTS